MAHLALADTAQALADSAVAAADSASAAIADSVAQSAGAAESITANIYQYIQDGGPPIMWTLVTLFGIGLAVFLWRFIVIVVAMFFTSTFYKKIFKTLNEDDGLDKAMKLCKKTPGPVATIVHAGLTRVDKGIDHVEKAVESAGSVEMSFLENGLVWLATIANIAPMIGFFGTVSGMIIAFQKIAEAGDVDPSVVAGGISMALITTAGGLLVAIPIQFFYNLCVYLIDRIVVSMEENASRFIDLLVDLGYDKK